MRRSVLLGTGSALPRRALGNEELARMVDTSDEWIVERTGIRNRYVAGDDETTSSLATEACRKAIEAAGIEAETIDLIVLATATPDQTFPATATIVQDALGCNGGIAFDVAAVCSGFLYALAVADSMLRSGMANRALVIGSETFSRILDWEDRSTCVLFGNGDGAIVIEAQEDGAAEPRGILATRLHADGAHNQLLYVDGGVSSTQTTGVLKMEGREIFKHAVQKLAQTAESALEKAGVSAADVDWIVPHQANLRIITATAQKMGVPMDRVVVTVQDHGNTSAASIPLAMSVGKARGQIKEGELLVAEAIGGGLAWGSVVLRW